MSKFVSDVQAFHKKFDLPTDVDNPHFPSDEVMDFRLGFLMEELDEIGAGIYNSDLEEVADGLIDLIYVAIGTGLFMGLPMDELWDEVQRANMDEVRAKSADESKRDSRLDVVKPSGWRGPDITRVLQSCHSKDTNNG